MHAPVHRRRHWAFAALGPVALLAAACSGSPGGAAAGAGGRSGSTTQPSGTSAAARVVPDSRLLPPPARVPAGTPAQQAAVLAHALHSGGPQVLPALLTALRLSGIAVRDLALGDRVVLAAAEPAQGTAVQAGLVAAYGSLEAGGGTVPLEQLTGVLAAYAPKLSLSGTALAGILVDTVRERAGDRRPTLAFWAQLVVDLGRLGPGHESLLGHVDRASVRLDAVQVLLLLWRTIGDLSAYAASHGTNVAATTTGAGVVLDAYPTAEPPAPCRLEGTQDQVVDAAQTLQSAAGDRLMDKLTEEAAQTVADVLSAAGAVLSVGKAVAFEALYAVTARFEQSPPPPLVRTHTTQPGAQARLKVTLEVLADAGAWSKAASDCLRAFNTGARQSGPVDGADVVWTAGALGDTEQPIEFTGSGCSGTECRTATGGDGSTSIGVQGRAQAADLPAGLPAVQRTVDVDVAVALKPSNLASDIVSSLGMVVKGGLDAAELLKGLLDAMHARGATYVLKVKDWAHDYLVSYVSPVGVRVSGGVCNGPAGTWHLHVAGGVQDVKVTGEVTFTLDKYLRSNDVAGYEEITLPYVEPTHVEISGGKATLSGPGSGATLSIQADVSLSGEFHGSAFGGKGFSVHVGDFCPAATGGS